MMYVNQTPVRTCVNYGINNLAVEDFNYNVPPMNSMITALKVTTKPKCKFSAVMGGNLDALTTQNTTHYLMDGIKAVLAYNLSHSAAFLNTFTIASNTTNNLVIALDSINVTSSTAFKFEVQDNATLNLIVFNNLGNVSTDFTLLDFVVGKGACVNVDLAQKASKTSAIQCHFDMQKDDSKVKLNGIYLGSGDSMLDLNYMADVYGKNSLFDMNIVGALDGQATKRLKATINFHKGAAGSKGYENENCLMLSPTTHSTTLPMILCGEEDVDGKHATSVGQVDENKLFYLMSRGLSRGEAINLIVKAQFGIILNNYFDTTTANQILQIIDKEFSK